jgi:hypothetical protein
MIIEGTILVGSLILAPKSKRNPSDDFMPSITVTGSVTGAESPSIYGRMLDLPTGQHVVELPAVVAATKAMNTIQAIAEALPIDDRIERNLRALTETRLGAGKRRPFPR